MPLDARKQRRLKQTEADPEHKAHRLSIHSKMSGETGGALNPTSSSAMALLPTTFTGSARVADLLGPLETQGETEAKRARLEDMSKSELITIMKTMTESMNQMMLMAKTITEQVPIVAPLQQQAQFSQGSNSDFPSTPIASTPIVTGGRAEVVELKIHPDAWVEMEQHAGEFQKNLLKNIKTKRRLKKHEDELVGLRSGKLPPHVKPFKVPFESEHVDNTYAGEEIPFSHTVPQGTSFRDAMRLSHLAYQTNIKAIEIAHQKHHLEELKKLSTFEQFTEKVNAIKYDRLSHEVDGLDSKWCLDIAQIQAKALTLWKTKLEVIEKILEDEAKNEEKKKKADSNNLKKVADTKPIEPLKSFIKSTIAELHASPVRDMTVDADNQLSLEAIAVMNMKAQDDIDKTIKVEKEMHNAVAGSIRSLGKGKGTDKVDGPKGKGKGKDDKDKKGKGKNKGKVSKSKGKDKPAKGNGKGKGKDKKGKGKGKGGKSKNY